MALLALACGQALVLLSRHKFSASGAPPLYSFRHLSIVKKGIFLLRSKYNPKIRVAFGIELQPVQPGKCISSSYSYCAMMGGRGRRNHYCWLLSLMLVDLHHSRRVEASSHYKRGDAHVARREYNPFPFIDDESSSYHGTSSVNDLLGDDEERMLAALAQIEDNGEDTQGFAFRPKARAKAVLREEPYYQTREGQHETRSGRKRRRKVSRPDQENDPASAPSLARESSIESTMTEQKTSLKAEHEEKPTIPLSMPPKPSLSQQEVTRQAHPLPAAVSSTMATGSSHVVPRETTASTTTPWVRRYLSSRTKDVLLPVPKEYIADGFNLAQLAPIVERIGFQVMGARAVEVAKRLVDLPSPQPSYPIYRLALQLLLNENEEEEATLLTHPLIPPEAIQQAAEALYLMVHARFVTSPRGLDALRRILLSNSVFGKCPRIQCEGTMLLPYGASNDYTSNSQRCQRYCPSCGNLWNCWESKTDGCAWGPSLCYLLLMAHGHELYPMARHRQAHVSSTIVHPNDPRVFGFRIHPAASWGRPLTGS